MGQILGKITVDEPEGPRGPDLTYRIEVPEAWFREGVGIEIDLPRRLACARCEGGGCDVCGRAGALALRRPEDELERLFVSLPEAPENGAVVLKIPDAGAPSLFAASAAESLEASEPPRAAEMSPEKAAAQPGPETSIPRAEPQAAPGTSIVRAEPSPVRGLGIAMAESPAPERADASPAAVPARGARGMLFLRVSVGPEPSSGVRRAYGVQSAAALSEAERRKLMGRSALLVGGLLLLFLVMLWLSGWL